MLEVLYHHAKFGAARISPAAGVTKNVEFLSVRHAFVRHAFVRHAFVRHAFERQSLCAQFRHEGVGVHEQF